MDDAAELDGLLGALSADAARAAGDALESVLGRALGARATHKAGGENIDGLVEAIVAALGRQAGGARRQQSGNQIAAAVARAVQKGARFT